MKIIITGAQGQLGQEIISQLNDKYEIYGFSSRQLDVTNIDSIYKYMINIRPDIIVNCAAYNLVDDAESNPNEARKVNILGPENIAEVSSLLGTLMVHFSTDFVFDGKSKVPYNESNQTGPINVYGQTKLAGEQRVQQICSRYIILRTAWLYGSSRKNFFNSIIEGASRNKVIDVVDDQVGSPTYLPELVTQLRLLIDAGIYGLYHCSGNSYCSRYEFAKRILSLMRINAEVNSVKTKEFPHKAIRPEFSALSNSLLEGCVNRKMPHWDDSLREYVEKLTNGL